MEIAKEKYDAVMLKYSQASGGGLEKKTSDAFTDSVRKAVTDSQKFADGVVNRLTVRKKVVEDGPSAGQIVEAPADLDAAKESLVSLAKSVGPVAEHWRPFIEATCEVLQVDVSGVLPRDMVPDPAALESSLEKTLAALKEQSQKADALEKLLKESRVAQAELGNQLEAAKRAQADLSTENEALKGQLANAKADASPKPGKQR